MENEHSHANGVNPDPDPYSTFVTRLADNYRLFIRDSDSANDQEIRNINAVVEHLIVLDPATEPMIDPT